MFDNPKRSSISLLVVDMDYTSLYPSLMVALNSGRNTLHTVLIEISMTESIYDFSSKLSLLTENATDLGENYLGLNNYIAMKKRIAVLLEREGCGDENNSL